MSQQINLLAHEERPPGLTALRALIGVGLLIPPMLAYGAHTWLASSKLADVAAQNDAVIAAESAGQKALAERLGSGQTPANLSAQIDALKAQSSQSQQILSLLQGGADKGSEGYSSYLSLLARVTEDGLWLTSVKISNAGKSVSLAGHSMHKETVLKYVQRLNEAFVPYGVRFTALELSPETGKEGASVTPLSSVTFKLN